MTDYYVDTINGDSGNNGLTPETAFKSIADIFSFLPQGEHTIYCTGGVDVLSGPIGRQDVVLDDDDDVTTPVEEDDDDDVTLPVEDDDIFVASIGDATAVTVVGTWSGFDVREDCYYITRTPMSETNFSLVLGPSLGKKITYERMKFVTHPDSTAPSGSLSVIADLGAEGELHINNSCALLSFSGIPNPPAVALIASQTKFRAVNSIFMFDVIPVQINTNVAALRNTGGQPPLVSNCILTPGINTNVPNMVVGRSAADTQYTNTVMLGRNVDSTVKNCVITGTYTGGVQDGGSIVSIETMKGWYVDADAGNFTPVDLETGPTALVDEGLDYSANVSSLDINGNDRNDPKAGVAWDIGPYEWGFAAEPPTGGSNVIGGPFRTSGAGTEAPTYTTRTTQTYAQVSVDLSVGWVLADADGFAANRLPAGLSMSPQGLVTGTSQSVQSVTGIVVSNSGVNSNAFTWDVTLGAAIAPSYEARNITVNVPHSANLASGWQNTDGSGFTIDALPTGLAMSSAGAVTGTPTVLDEVVASRVTHRGVSSAAFTWTVVGNQTVAPSYSDREVTVDVPVSVNLAVGWQNADPSGFTIDALPTGLSMNTIGLVTGTPTVLNETVASSVTNSGVTSNAFTWDVAGKPVVVPTYTNRRVIVDVPYTVDLSIGWQNSDGSDFTIDALPTGLSMSTAGVVTGTPTVLPEVTVSTVSHMGLTSNAFTWTVVTRPPSGTLADAKFDALRDQGFTGSISDMTLQWLQANGATSGSITDAWLEVLPGTGQRNDRWYTVLGGMGYTGSLNDREFAFWVDGGVLPAGAQDSGPANLEAFLISEGWGVTRTGENFVVRSGVHEWRFTWSEAEAGVYEQDLPAPLRNDIDDSFGR